MVLSNKPVGIMVLLNNPADSMVLSTNTADIVLSTNPEETMNSTDNVDQFHEDCTSKPEEREMKPTIEHLEEKLVKAPHKKESFIKNSPSSNRTKEVVSLKRKASTKQFLKFEIESKKKVKKLSHGQSAGAADANFTTEKIADPIEDIISNRRKNSTPNHIMTEIKSKHTQQEPKVQVVDTFVLSSNKKRIDDKFPKVAIADCAPGGISNFYQKPSHGSKLTSNASVA